MVAPELTSTIVGIVMVVPVLVRQVAGLRHSPPAPQGRRVTGFFAGLRGLRRSASARRTPVDAG